MRKRMLWLATVVGAFLALHALPILAAWRPGHG